MEDGYALKYNGVYVRLNTRKPESLPILSLHPYRQFLFRASRIEEVRKKFCDIQGIPLEKVQIEKAGKIKTAKDYL